MGNIGVQIQRARTARGKTQSEVAALFGISRVSVAQWEGRGNDPQPDRLPVLAQFLDVPIAWLLSDNPDVPASVGALQLARPAAAVPVTPIVPGTDLISARKMPVYAAAMGGEGHIIVTFDQIDEVKRPTELENVKGGYGLLVKGSSMVPAFREGDMALVNPHLPPGREKNVILYHTPPDGGDVEAMIKELQGWNDRVWHLKQWNPVKEFDEFRKEWPVCHRVVGKYDGR